MAEPQVFRVERSDVKDGFVLLHVRPEGGIADEPPPGFQLEVFATEGEQVYNGRVRECHIERIRGSRNTYSEAEWRAIVALAFKQKPPWPGQDEQELLRGLEWTASVQDPQDHQVINGSIKGKCISLVLKKRVGGISQRLCTVSFAQCDDEISVFDWCGTAAKASGAAEAELAQLRRRVGSLEALNRALQGQLDEFARAKRQADEQLMAKFAVLLNEKKLKIRNQQRVLAALKVDPDDVSQSQTVIKSEKKEGEAAAQDDRLDGIPLSNEALPHRAGKRRRGATPADDDDDNEARGLKADRSGTSDAAKSPYGSDATQTDSNRSTPQPLEEDDVETESEAGE
ncbi:hypothetical protein KEM52_006571 [Ascosphaera acerosa]|nr:hypothetical protein KEM52_006571 [Ascosphaera acerosa]